VFSISLKSYHWIHRLQPFKKRPVPIAHPREAMSEIKANDDPLISRRTALAAVATMSLSIVPANAEGAATELVRRAAEKNAAFMRGDMARWSELTRIAPGFTLMQPFGGPASHGFDSSPRRLEEMSRFFRNCMTDLEVAATYASEDIVVLAMIERQRAEVGGLPEQDWSLRVTEVYRKDGSDWQLAHRQADPLVQRVSLEKAAALARGAA
jgi:hypothetical protein